MLPLVLSIFLLLQESRPVKLHNYFRPSLEIDDQKVNTVLAVT